MTQAQGMGGTGGTQRETRVDWSAAEQLPEFKELVRKRRSFVVPATAFFLIWYFGFIVLAGYAEDFMGREFITDGITVGYALALTQFLMVWGLCWLYLRKADRDFDPLAERAAKRALDLNGHADPERRGRFDRDTAEPFAPAESEEVDRR